MPFSTQSRSSFAIFLTVVVAAGARRPEPLQIEARVKPRGPWKTYATRILDHLPDFQPADKPPELGRYGGLRSKRFDATGFFHTRKAGDRRVLVDPEGYLFLSIGVNSVRPPRRPGPAYQAMVEKFGGRTGWADATTEFLRQNGFNTTGNWSDNDALGKAERRLPYTTSMYFVTDFAKKLGLTTPGYGHAKFAESNIPVFHPDFERWCDEYAGPLAKTRDDPYLLGHFSDNELPDTRRLLTTTLQIDPDHPALKYNREAAWKWFRNRKGNDARAAGATAEDNLAWLGRVMDRYYEVTTRAIRRHDPNHLCLGSRIHGGGKAIPEVIRAAGSHLDVISINYYGHWTPSREWMKMWAGAGRKPFLITEWYVKGEDTGLENEAGAGWIVRTQADRGRFYQNWTLTLLQSKHCVGWHWFKYRDDGRGESKFPSNKGMVSAAFEPYAPLVEQMRQLNSNAYGLTGYFDGR